MKVALEALKEQKPLAELSSKHEVHRVQIQAWKKTITDYLTHVFGDHRIRENKNKDRLIDELYKEIGKLKVAKYWGRKILRLYGADILLFSFFEKVFQDNFDS